MSNRKVLLVDDSKSARYALKLLLQKQNLEVDTAESAEDALAKIKENAPEAVFMDNLMPGMNGLEALEILKKDATTAHIPVVMCTSNDEDHHQHEAREKGALGILPKPATPNKLADILTAIESNIQAHAQAPEKTEPSFKPVAATTAIDYDQIVDLIRNQLFGLLRVELSTLLEIELPPRVDAIQNQLHPVVVQTVKEQLRQEIEAVRTELVHMETEHAQAAAYKLSHEVLPEMINKKIVMLTVQVNEHIESRLEKFSGKIGKKLLQEPAFVRQFSESAEATGKAREIAESVATEHAAKLADSLTHSAQGSLRRMYFLAAGAATVGIAAAFVVNMLF